MTALFAIRAQVEAEVASRLRSPGTAVAVLFLVAGSWLWIPPAGGKAASITWNTPDGVTHAPFANASALGYAVAWLLVLFFLVAAFYLVVGSLARDRRLGIGVIVAATPVSKAVLLAGRLVAHAVYLGALSLVAFGVGLAVYLERGVGPFEPRAFVAPPLLVLAGGVLVVPALTLLFETVPGLRGKAGLVLWWLIGMPLLIALPASQVGPLPKASSPLPIVDPLGAATLSVLLARSLPEAVEGTVSAGLVILREPPALEPWSGIAPSAGRIAGQLATSLALAALPLGLAVLFFDRFDPARARRRLPRLRRRQPPEEAFAPAPAPAPPSLHVGELAPVSPRPGAGKAIVAEALLIVQAAGAWRWLLIAGAVAVPVVAVAAPIARGPVAVLYLLLLGVLLADVGARERLAGTTALVFAQPGVPRSVVLWKLGASAMVALAAGLPLLVAAALASPDRVVAALVGLATLAAAATALGLLSGGPKVLLGVLTLLAYLGVQAVPVADLAGVAGAPLAVPFAYLAVAVVLVAVALVRERAAVSG